MMTTVVAKATPPRIQSGWAGQDTARFTAGTTKLMEDAAREAQDRVQVQGEVRIEAYAPYLSAPNGWLSAVEARIRDSVLPDELRGDLSAEWLTEDAANAAIAFFRAGADVLPAEPHIYATESGDLVAEFETQAGSMTSVVTDRETILFAVLVSEPQQPMQRVIRRGSNKFRDELRSFTRRLTAGSHGKMGTAR